MCKSAAVIPASFKAFCTGTFVASIKSLINSSNFALVNVMSKCFGPFGGEQDFSGTFVLGYGSLSEASFPEAGETLRKVCTAAREASVTV